MTECTYPFTQFDSDFFLVNGNRDQKVFKKDNTCIINSIFACSQNDEAIFLNMYIQETLESGEKNMVPLGTKIAFLPFETRELIPCSVLNMTPDITLFAYTNGPLNLVSLTISYRALYLQEQLNP